VRIVFFGTPQFSADFLTALLDDNEIEVAAVVTQPDEPQGRKRVLTPPPVKVLAESRGIPVWQPTRIKENVAMFETLRAYKADAFVVIAYGRILPQALLDIPARGVVNVHPSLLPKYRGPSPMQAAIAAGDAETGISIMLIDALMDHGPILAVEKLTIDPRETTESLTKKVTKIGAPLLVDTLKKWIDGAITPVEQDHSAATICSILKREDGIIDWSQPAEVIDRKLRAFTPWPGMSTTWTRNGTPVGLKIIRAMLSDKSVEPGRVLIDGNQLYVGTSSTALQITDLQPAGGKPMDAGTFIRGYHDIDGTRLN
jgi:methionyl-tRNA formyltransferase